MAYGHESLPTKKYSYGISHRPHGTGHKPNTPFPGQAEAIDQLYKAHKFQNELVAIELERRKAYKAILHNANPALDALEKAALDQEEVIKLHREQLGKSNSAAQAKNSNAALTAVIKAEVEVLTANWKAYEKEKKTTQALATVKEQAKQSGEEFKEKRKEARNAAVEGGLYWGSAADVETRVKQTGYPPKFKRFTGEGLLACQIQAKPAKGATKQPVYDQDGKPKMRGGKPLQVSSGYAPFTEQEAREGTSLLKIAPTTNPKYVNVHLRIASAEKGKPVWVILPVIWHRALPVGANIKWVYLSRKRYGCYWKWEVLFDVAKKEWEEKERSEGTVAVALGFRKIDGALRVAHWVGEDGKEGDIVIPAERLDAWQQVDQLQGIRDLRFEADKKALVAWLATQQLSDEWKAKTQALDKWKSPARLASLVLWWRNNRLTGDNEIYTRLEGETLPGSFTGGRRQDKHLVNWQESQRKHLRDWRKWFYRNIACELRKSYRNVVTAEIDWAKLGEQPEIESSEEMVYQKNRGIASVGALRETLNQYLIPVEVSAVNIAKTCHQCGTVCKSPGTGRYIVCETCNGVKLDRAENAAKNLLAMALSPAVAI